MSSAREVAASRVPSSSPTAAAAAAPKPTGAAASVRAAARGMSYDEGAKLLAPSQMKTTLGSYGGGVGQPTEWSAANPVVKSGQSGGGYDFDDLDERLDDARQRGGVAGAQAGTEDGQGMFTTDHVGSGKTGAQAGVAAGAGVAGAGFVKGFATPDAWLDGERASVAGRGEVRAGLGGSASANAYAEGGPALGSIDPDTGERRGMATAEAGAGVEAFVGARASGAGEAYVEGLGVGAAGRGEVSVGGNVSANGAARAGVELGGMNLAGIGAQGSASGSYGVSAEGAGEVQAGIGTTLLAAKGNIGASAMAGVEGQGSVAGSLGGLEGRAEASGHAEIAGTASASGEIAVGPGSLGARGEVEAFAGVRAGGSVGVAAGALGCDLFKLSLNGTVAAGVGAGAGGGLMLKDGVLFIDAELMAAAGVGGSVGMSCSLDLLFPFHVLFKMLEANGVLSTRPENHITEIFGYILQKKQVKGPKPKAETPEPMKCYPGRSGRAEDAPASDDAAIYEAFEAAGARVDRRAGTIDTRGPDVDPMALVGALPGEAGARYDAAIAPAGERIGVGQAAAATAPKDLGGGMANAVQEAFGSIVELVNGALALCKGTFETVQALVTSGVQGAITRGAALIQTAWNTAKAALEAAANWFLRLFSWLGSIFGVFDRQKGESAGALFGEIGTVFSAVGALVSGNQGALAALAPQLAHVAAKLGGDGGAFAQAAGDKADEARADVTALHGAPLDLGTFAGKMAISDRGRADYAQVSKLLRNDGKQAAQKSGGQLSSLPEKVNALGGQSAQGATGAALAGSDGMKQAFEERRVEADGVARDGKSSSNKDAQDAGAAAKERRGAA